MDTSSPEQWLPREELHISEVVATNDSASDTRLLEGHYHGRQVVLRPLAGQWSASDAEAILAGLRSLGKKKQEVGRAVGLCQDQDEIFVVMEKPDGARALRDILRSKRSLTWNERFHVALMVCEILKDFEENLAVIPSLDTRCIFLKDGTKHVQLLAGMSAPGSRNKPGKVSDDFACFLVELITRERPELSSQGEYIVALPSALRELSTLDNADSAPSVSLSSSQSLSSSLSTSTYLSRRRSLNISDPIDLSSSGAFARKDSSMQERNWEKAQIMAFTAWLNSYLVQRNMSMQNLQSDLQDGVLLNSFLEIITHNKLPRWRDKPNSKIMKMENLTIGINYIQEDMGIRLVGIGSEDVYNGNLKLILGLVWSLFKSLQQRRFGAVSMEEGLLRWVREQTAKYDGAVSEPTESFFKHGFKDGRTLAALLHQYDPSILDFDAAVKEKTPEELLQLVFEMAEKHLNVPRLLDPSELQDPDERIVQLYVSLLFDAMSLRKETAEIDAIPELVATFEPIHFPNDCPPWCLELIKKCCLSNSDERPSLDSMREKLKEMLQEHLSEQDKVEEAEKKVEDNPHTISLHVPDNRDVLRKRLQRKKEMIKTLKSEKELLLKQFDEKEHESKNSYDVQIKDIEHKYEQQISQIRDQLATSESSAQKLTAEADELRAKLNTTHLELQQAEQKATKLEELETAAAAATVEIEKLRKQLEEKEAQESSEDIHALKLRLEDLDDKSKKLQQENDQLKTECESYRNSTQEQDQKHSAEIHALQEKLQELHASLELQKQESDQLRDENKTLQMIATRDSDLEKIKVLSTENEELIQQLNSRTSELNRYKAELEDIKSTNLNEEEKRTFEAFEELTAKLEAARKEKEDSIKDLTTKLEMKEQQIIELERVMEDLKQQQEATDHKLQQEDVSAAETESEKTTAKKQSFKNLLEQQLQKGLPGAPENSPPPKQDQELVPDTISPPVKPDQSNLISMIKSRPRQINKRLPSRFNTDEAIANEKVKELELRIQEYQVQLRTQTEESLKQHQELMRKLSSLEDEKHQLAQELDSLKTQIAEFASIEAQQKDESNIQISELSNKLASAMAEMEKLEVENQNLTQRIKDLENESKQIQILETQNNELMQEVEENKRTITELQDRLSRSAETTSLQEENKSEEMKKLHEQIVQLKSDIQARDSASSSIVDRLNKEKGEAISSLQADHEELKARWDSEREAMQVEIDRLKRDAKGQHDEKDQKLGRLGQMVDESQAALEKKRKENEELAEQIKGLQKQDDQQKNRIADLSIEIEVLQQKLIAAEKNEKDAAKRAEDTERQLVLVENNLEELRKRDNSGVTESMAETEAARHRLLNLELELERALRERDEMERANMSLQNRIRKLETTSGPSTPSRVQDPSRHEALLEKLENEIGKMKSLSYDLRQTQGPSSSARDPEENEQLGATSTGRQATPRKQIGYDVCYGLLWVAFLTAVLLLLVIVHNVDFIKDWWVPT